MELKGLKLSKNNIEQKINLKKEFGKKAIDDQELKEAITQELINIIIERTSRSKDVNGEKMQGYSKSYRQSEDFKLYGKTSKVDMTMRGDMLEAIDKIKESSETITLGFDDELQRKKAANHNGGFTVPQRQFFGVTQDDIDKVKKKFKNDLKDDGASLLQGLIASQLLADKENQNLVNQILAGFNFG
ncbi:MAG: hypothetical protein OEL89_00680 [Candidatus Peregrinibacteria bacterium]|nr:hypothetical protein [Candidatus Peregrinibacteria bacterium]